MTESTTQAGLKQQQQQNGSSQTSRYGVSFSSGLILGPKDDTRIHLWALPLLDRLHLGSTWRSPHPPGASTIHSFLGELRWQSPRYNLWGSPGWFVPYLPLRASAVVRETSVLAGAACACSQLHIRSIISYVLSPHRETFRQQSNTWCPRTVENESTLKVLWRNIESRASLCLRNQVE